MEISSIPDAICAEESNRSTKPVPESVEQPDTKLQRSHMETTSRIESSLQLSDLPSKHRTLGPTPRHTLATSDASTCFGDDHNEWTELQSCCTHCGLEVNADYPSDYFRLCRKCNMLCCSLCVPGKPTICKDCRLVKVTCAKTLDHLKQELLAHGASRLLRESADAEIGLQRGTTHIADNEAARYNIIQQLASIECCPRFLGKREQDLAWRFSEELVNGPQGADWFVLFAEMHIRSTSMVARVTTKSDLNVLLQHIDGTTNCVCREIETFDQEGNVFWLCPGDTLKSCRERLGEINVSLDSPCDLTFHRDSASSVATWARKVKLQMRQAMCTLAVLSRAHSWACDYLDVLKSMAEAVGRTLLDVYTCPEELLMPFMTYITMWLASAPRAAVTCLQSALLNRAKDSEQVCSSLFWTLRQLLKSKKLTNARASLMYDSVERFQRSLWKTLPDDLYETLQSGVTFFSRLIEEWHDLKSDVVSLKEEWFPSSGFVCAPCFELCAVSLDTNVIPKRFNSATRPVKFGLHCALTSDGSRSSRQLIYKEDEDIFKEQLISSILRQLEQLWLRDAEVKQMFENLLISLPDSSLIPRIQQVAEGVAVIEVVSNAHTIKELSDMSSAQSFRPVHRYLQNSNGTLPWQQVARRFGVTSAFWLVVSSLLGLGDRHYGNVMVRKDGSLVHIDYGHILGSDAKIKKLLQRIGSVGAIRVDLQDLQDILGNDMELAFWQPLRLTFNVLRSHARLLVEQLRIVEDVFPQDIDVAAFVVQRCHPNRSDQDAGDIFVALVEECAQSSYVPTVDFMHSQAQKKIISNAVDCVASTFGGMLSSTFQAPHETLDEWKAFRADDKIRWMWADANLLGTHCGQLLARADPLRWSRTIQIKDAKEDLLRWMPPCQEDRPVEIWIQRTNASVRFGTMSEAISALRTPLE